MKRNAWRIKCKEQAMVIGILDSQISWNYDAILSETFFVFIVYLKIDRETSNVNSSGHVWNRKRFSQIISICDSLFAAEANVNVEEKWVVNIAINSRFW